MKGDREQADKEGSSRKDSEEPRVMGRSGCLEMWGKDLPTGQSVRGSRGGKELVDCGPNQSTRGIGERDWEEVRKIVRDHVLGGVWDLLQI